MKKLLSVILAALVLTAAFCVPAAAEPVYSPVTVPDGASVITFTEARQEAGKAILVARQSWVAGSALPVVSESERVEAPHIVVKPGSQINRGAGAEAVKLAFATRADNGSYLLSADRLYLYSMVVNLDEVFSFPFVKADLVILITADGSEYVVRMEGMELVEAPPIPIPYTVKEGDTLDSIALNYYAVPNLGAFLQQANAEYFAASGGVLQVGGVLTLPTTLADRPRLKAPLAAENELIYVIGSGDTLSTISQRFYGRGDFSSQIYQRNADLLANPDILVVGQVIVLPVIRT